MDLNERSRSILSAIIQSYVSNAEPVGSRTITKRFELGISPATVRNIMSDLEDMGLLAQPHTSAGRIPTDKAYRFYIDTLLEVRQPTLMEEELVQSYPLPREDFPRLMQETTKLLSGLSHYTGVVRAPRPAENVYTHIEFVRLTGKRALAIFVSKAGIVHNRIVSLEEDLTQHELERLSVFLNREMGGLTLTEIRKRVLSMMEHDRNQYTKLLSKLMKIWGEAVPDERESSGELYIGGMSELLNLPEFHDMDRMRDLFHAFEEKHSILTLLDKAIEADGVQVYIGSENPFFDMQGVSLVVANYRGEGNVVGTLGVIGPSRMAYNTVIPLVDCTAKVLGRLLSEK